MGFPFSGFLKRGKWVFLGAEDVSIGGGGGSSRGGKGKGSGLSYA